MQPSKPHGTAILIFANAAEEDCRHKGILNGRVLFDTLTRHTLTVVKKSKIPFFHCSGAQQHGHSFGMRFVNAVQQVFDQGFERIITIGNDSPQLTAAHLRNAQGHLEQGRSVIGPAADGGFYLMGIAKAQFNASDFEGLSWNTPKISNEVMGLLARKCELVSLKTLFDVDTIADLQRLAHRFKDFSISIFEIFLSLFLVRKALDHYARVYIPHSPSSTPFNKGSPLPLHS